MTTKRPPPPPVPVRRPKKPKARKTRSKGGGTGSTVVDLAGVPRQQAALWRAFQLFIEDPDAQIKHVWEHGRLSPDDPDSPLICECVGTELLYRTAQEQNWKERKREFWRAVQDRVLAESHKKIVELELQGIATLEQVHRRALAHLIGDEGMKIEAIKPRSFEGVGRLLVYLDQRISDKRGGVAQMLAQASSQQGASLGLDGQTPKPVMGRPPPQIEDGFSDEEVRAMAQHLAAVRAGIVDPSAEGGSDGGGTGGGGGGGV